MLVMTPAMAKAQRAAKRRTRESERGRLGRDRFTALAGELAQVIGLAFAAGETGSLFGLEGPLRAGLRSDLCLAGWRWDDADAMARELLGEALRRARAVRPTWYEGQPEWTIRPGALIERTRCIKCHKPLPPENHKFCGQLCAMAHGKRLEALRKGSADTAVRIATRSI